MEKTKTVTTIYKEEDVIVEIDKNSYGQTFVHISNESATGKINRLSLTQNEAVQLVTILHIANEEGEI